MENLYSLRAGYATIGQGAGPMLVTAKAGLFDKHGLHVEVRLMDGARGVVRGLMGGEIQFGNLACPALLRANLRAGADLVFLTGGINQQFLMGRPGIDSRRGLTGGKVGFVDDGGLNDILAYFVMDQLKKEGISGVQIVPTTSGRKKIERLLHGESDAEIITPPEAIEAKRQGCRILVDFAEYGLNFALGGIAARRAYIREHDKVTRGFVKAYVEGMHRYRTDRAFTVQVQQEYSGISDRSIAEETYDVTQPGMPAIPRPVLPALKIALDVMARKLPEAKKADAQQFVDGRFISELVEGGFISLLYGK